MAMAEEAVKLEGKVETNIRLKIVEAKNLPHPHELKHYRDTYVVIALDQEEIFRTATVERSLSPFFGEEYRFKVPRDFSKLTFYICEPGLHKDSKLGKVAIFREDLKTNPTREESWFPLQYIDADSEVQGKIHLSLNLEEILVAEGECKQVHSMLTVRVFKAVGLSTWCSCSYPDSYCQVTLISNVPGMKSEVKRGTTRKRTADPIFQDTFSFPIRDFKNLLNAIVRVSLWHDPLIGEKIFLGQVNLSIGSLKSFLNHDGWHWLCPRPTAPTQANRPDIGSLRIKVYYSQDVIYPLKVYDMLSHLLVESTVCPDLSNTVLFMLSEVHRDWSAMGHSFVRIFLALNKLEILLEKLIQHEVEATSDPNTLFRGNSLASKVIDEFMKLVGQSYLQRTLQGCIDEIFEVQRHCEIDPSRLIETDNRDLNKANLLFFIEKVLSAIFASARSCPKLMCKVFSLLRESAVAKFPDQVDVVRYTSVSGFIFLRFFAPAILNPRLFHLRQEFPNAVVARTLTLISKSIQSLSNIGGPKLTSSLQHKEGYMTELQMELSDHIDDVKSYLTAISNPHGGEQCTLGNTVYREGMLTKRSQGRKRGPKNFRKRFFCLSRQCLTYSKAKGEQPLCTIPSNEMLAVERVDENTFGMKFMFQLVQPERILYMQAKNSVDEVEWLTALSKACVQNSSQTLFHSGAFITNSWSCCGSPSIEISKGCKPISLAIKMLAQQENIDLERELHNVYKMFCENQTKLIAMKDKDTSSAREKGNEDSLPPRLTALCELIVFTKNLELLSNSQLQSMAHKVVLGSKDSPHRCSTGEALVIL